MKLKLVSLTSKASGEVELNDDVFGITPRTDIMHRVVLWQQAKSQAGTHKTKERSDVSGTTAKPYRQKGTGNARRGTMRASQHRGGATTFGPRVRSHAHKLPRKVRQLGLKSALSAKMAAGQIKVIDSLVIEKAGTAAVKAQIAKLGVSKPLFVRGDNAADEFAKSIRNLPYTDAIAQGGLNVYDILRHDDVIITSHALKDLEARLAA
ncbi:MAG: 50S ribosomal protein L4 [Rickettsiales bacterium]|nr:50S ribosomal protein L4 [Rickettsiales bacterium]